jgi:putative ABC transport system permease protein
MCGDLRFALRSFRRNPAFTSVCLITLALGIGANTAIFSIVQAVILRPLPYENPDRLYRIRRGTSFPDLRDWTLQASSFSAIGGFRPQTFDYAREGEADRFDGALVTGDLLNVLGARTRAGRPITRDDDRLGAERVAMVSAGFWRTRFASDANVVGRRMRFNDVPYTIVGVLDDTFALPGARADVFAPFYPDAPREAESRGAHTLRAIVRVRDDVGASAAQDEMNALADRLERQFPETNRGVRFTLLPLADSQVSQIKPALVLLLGTVVSVLAIACVNVANLLIARGASRRSELAIRAALGAGRGRLARQLLTESILLAGAGGLLGLLVARWTLHAVVALAPEGVPRLDQAALDPLVLTFAAVLSVATGLLFGLLPAWTAASTPLDVARGSGRATLGPSRARDGLMVLEIALALVLVVGTGLLLRSFHRLAGQPTGFEPAGLVTANVTFSGQRYLDTPRRTQLFEAFEARVASMPGVRAVGFTTDLPIGGSPIFHNLAFDGRPMAPGTEPEVYYRGVSTGYFEALRIPMRRGRSFTDADRAGAPLVAIVNEAFVREYYPADEPIGRRIRWVSGPGEWITIVGVVADVRGLSLESAEIPAVHVPYRQEQAAWRMWMDIAVRTGGDPATIARAMRQELARLDPSVPLTKVGTMSGVLERSLAGRRFNLFLLGGFASLALALAAAGTYGVMAYTVSRRTREVGVRIALGATSRDVLRLIVGRGLLLAGGGVAAGLAAAFGAARVWSGFIAGLLFEVTATDAVTLTAASLVLLATATAAAWVPARRAARVDPLTTLRSE